MCLISLVCLRDILYPSQIGWNVLAYRYVTFAEIGSLPGKTSSLSWALWKNGSYFVKTSTLRFWKTSYFAGLLPNVLF